MSSGGNRLSFSCGAHAILRQDCLYKLGPRRYEEAMKGACLRAAPGMFLSRLLFGVRQRQKERSAFTYFTLHPGASPMHLRRLLSN
jgi:hypothetical protein